MSKATVRPRPCTKASALPWKPKSKPASISSPENHGSSDSASPPHTSPSRKKSLPTSVAGAAAVLLPEGVVHVLHRVQPEAVHAGALRPVELRVQEVLRHLGQLRLEVRQAGDARRHVVLAAGAPLLRAQPALRLGIGEVARVVAGVVVDHVQQHADAAPVSLVHQRAQVLLGAEARIQLVEVVRPVAVIAPVREARAGDEAVDVLHHRGDPQRRHAQRADSSSSCWRRPLRSPPWKAPWAACPPRRCSSDPIREAIHDDEIEDLVSPAAGRHLRRGGRRGRRGCRGGGRTCWSRRRLRRRGGVRATHQVEHDQQRQGCMTHALCGQVAGQGGLHRRATVSQNLVEVNSPSYGQEDLSSRIPMKALHDAPRRRCPSEMKALGV